MLNLYSISRDCKYSYHVYVYSRTTCGQEIKYLSIYLSIWLREWEFVKNMKNFENKYKLMFIKIYSMEFMILRVIMCITL